MKTSHLKAAERNNIFSPFYSKYLWKKNEYMVISFRPKSIEESAVSDSICQCWVKKALKYSVGMQRTATLDIV